MGEPAGVHAPAATPATTTGWLPPDAETRLAAIGAMPAGWLPWFDPAAFEELAAPVPGDWPAEHEESGQSYTWWLASERRVPRAETRVIALQPVGAPAVDLAMVASVAEAWFGLPVRLEEAVSAEATGVPGRVHPTQGQQQLRSPDLLQWLSGGLTEEVFARVGVVELDLYPGEDWNFVFGQATYAEGVGVWSVARLDPGDTFPGTATDRQALTAPVPGVSAQAPGGDGAGAVGAV